jgi:tetratricopeptide (TPR) repeat protein
MKTAFRLRRRLRAEAAAALLLPSEDVDALLQLCVRTGQDPTGCVYRVAGGFLVRLSQPSERPIPGVIRLRGASANLYVPADADLVPPLLPDEQAGLTRRQGLVFLPGGRVLSFDPRQPLAMSALVDPGPVRRGKWESFPERPGFAERLREIRLELPPVPPEAILEEGAGDIGTEPPRPEGTGGLARAAGSAAMGLGRALHWLGNALHLRGVASLGAGLIAGALSLAPRLSESLLGKQEAALRELLRCFREGKLEQALRRALPLGGDPARGAQAAGDANLPVHNLRYSLSSLLNSRAASLWFGGGNVQLELAREYRKAAEQATRAGDYRRAAFIYGKLLHDFRSAADVLFRGGLFHDAAILYLEKLGDELMAAKAFAAAGDIERALELYRRKGEHLLAGDLLRRSGEEEAALAEYTSAAEQMVAQRQDYLAAGNLMLEHVGREDLARQYYRAGWALRRINHAVPCGRRLAWLYATHGQIEELLGLVGEMQTFFSSPGNEAAAADCFNHIASLADRPEVTSIRDELRDRALTTIAAKFRERAKEDRQPGSNVSLLLGHCRAWSPAIVRDADLGYRTELRRRRTRPRTGQDQSVTRVKVGNGTVTAVCHAPDSGEMFIGFEDGSVYSFQPAGASQVCRSHYRGPVHALACDAIGHFLVVLRSVDGETGELNGYARRLGTYWQASTRVVSGSGGLWLSPLAVPSDGDLVLALHNGERLILLRGSGLLSEGEVPEPFDHTGLSAILLLPTPGQYPQAALPLAVVFDALIPCTAGGQAEFTRLGARPGFRAGSTIQSTSLALLQPEPSLLHVAGVTAEGTVFWTVLSWEDGVSATDSVTTAGGYFATAFVRLGLLAAVTESRIDWYRRAADRLTLASTTRIDLPNVVACHACSRTQELMIILADGEVVTLRIPN